ncbi:uncharacterized protein LOC141729427 [Zonotrichia albicollis]|uniref:uncharacterized protein LOC141729427 n=1 Tax=Zonotrichia albicollis TaxID=44394 RepID=UPI003D810BF7
MEPSGVQRMFRSQLATPSHSPPNTNHGPFLWQTKLTCPAYGCQIAGELGTIKPARLGTGDSLSLGTILRTVNFQEPPGHYRPQAPKHKSRTFSQANKTHHSQQQAPKQKPQPFSLANKTHLPASGWQIVVTFTAVFFLPLLGLFSTFCSIVLPVFSGAPPGLSTHPYSFQSPSRATAAAQLRTLQLQLVWSNSDPHRCHNTTYIQAPIMTHTDVTIQHIFRPPQQIAGATWYNQTSPTWYWCHFEAGNYPVYCGFSGASRPLPGTGPQTQTTALFRGKQKSPAHLLGGRLQEPFGTLKPARLSTGATMGLGTILRIMHFQEPAGHSKPQAPNTNHGPFPGKQNSAALLLHGRLQEPLDNMKLARLSTGATLGLETILRTVDVQEPADNSRPQAPKHKPWSFPWQTNLTWQIGWQIAGATWYYQTSQTWHRCHLVSEDHPL